MIIDRENAKRIANDAYIAADALEGIILCGTDDRLYEDYLREKLDTVKRCVAFMEHFCGKENQ